MDWILFKVVDTPRDNKTGIEWLDKVLEIAAEITAREIQTIIKERQYDTILQSKRKMDSM